MTSAAPDLPSPELSLAEAQSAMSFQRTRLSIDRTLMSIVRTALALIGFGFTLFQVFHSWLDRQAGAVRDAQPRQLAMALIALGIVLLVLGLRDHRRSILHLRERAAKLAARGLMPDPPDFRATSTGIAATLLLLIGIAALADVTFRHFQS